MNRAVRVGYFQVAAAVAIVMASMAGTISVDFLRIMYIVLLVAAVAQIVWNAGWEGVKSGAEVFVNSMDSLTGKKPREVLTHLLTDCKESLTDRQIETVMAAMHIWGRTCEASALAWIQDGIKKTEESINEENKSTGRSCTCEASGDAGSYKGRYLHPPGRS